MFGRSWVLATVGGAIVAGGALLIAAAGCGGGMLLSPAGSLFPYAGSTGTASGPSTSGRTPGGSSGGAITNTDPCDESQSRKFVRISMRNQADDHVHYFLILYATISTADTIGTVCPDDIALYTAFGYEQIAEGELVEFGNYCFVGPGLLYFHRGGRFREGGSAGLASAIDPAQGSTPSYDAFFNANGAQVPVPSFILFHNPGTTAEGRALQVSTPDQSPCAAVSISVISDPDCQQDAFYYVDQSDLRAGSTQLGAGSFRRVPDEIQGTGCECGSVSSGAWSTLAPSTATASNAGTSAGCSWFFRGGRIDYVFVREDTDPPFPQLVWRVTDSAGQRAHDFDSRANIR